MTKWPYKKRNTLNSTKHTEQQDITDIQSKLFFNFSIFKTDKTKLCSLNLTQSALFVTSENISTIKY